uniref:GDP-fucose protein O-fucosyltransferase n=1 Tax=Clandestinovirus TaxID=2831644 RepID=A0A8F8PR36_9VIRU|nr:GDP-fucose protein O-fucosyltransferase [Clandestinovirus]
MEQKFITYQPCQGLGNQVMEFFTMIQLANATKRTLIIPYPVEHATDEPSILSPMRVWDLTTLSSTIQYKTIDQFTEPIDLAFRIIPIYLLSNVKLKSISDYYKLCPGAEKTINRPRVPSEPGRWKTLMVKTQFTMSGIIDLLEQEKDERTIYLSYVYDLIHPYIWPIKPSWNMPIRLHPNIIERAKSAIGDTEGQVTCSMHVRRGDMVTFLDITQSIVKLPIIDRYFEHIEQFGYNRLFIATDDNLLRQKGEPIKYNDCECPLDVALMDMAVCLCTDYFVGTYCSTFSQYIHHCRVIQHKQSHLIT